MSSALFISMLFLLLNVSLQVSVDEDMDEDIVRGFRELFASFLQPTSSHQTLKHARDTSKVEQNVKVNQTTGRRSVHTADSDTDGPRLTSLYSCDYEDTAARLCINVRQLGTTLTVGVRVQGPKEGQEKKSPIHWYRVFKVRGQSEKKSLSFNKLSRGNLPWNINLGGDDDELRISPIMESDFGYNFFLATIDEKSPQQNVGEKGKDHLQLMMFRIEPLNIDMGTLYHGEEITIDVRSHMELPAQSVHYEWARIGPGFEVVQNLPSNMKLSRDGSTLGIKEHKSHGDMVLTCAVFSNKNFTLARRNFYLKRIDATPDPRSVMKNGSRKRRYLDQFYARPSLDTDRFTKTKRSSSPTRDDELESDDDKQSIDDWEAPNQTPIDFPETSSFQQPTFPYEITDTPQETVLKFYENPNPKNLLPAEDPAPEKVEFEKQKSKSLKGLIEQANSVVEVDENGEESRYSTPKYVAEEKPTFEDRESMMIADCNEDADCGINAVCFRIGRDRKFCKCLPHYRGNGMFCWLF